VFSLEPLAQYLSEWDYGHALCKPVYPSSSPMICPNHGLKICCGDHCWLVVWGVPIAKIRFRAGGKIASWTVLRRGQRVRTGSVCYMCVLWYFHVLVSDRDILFAYHEASTNYKINVPSNIPECPEGGRGIAVLFLDLCARSGWSAPRLGCFNPEKDPVTKP
jgi:hypothetical protein